MRRRAAQVKAGEALTLIFADGEKRAFADGDKQVIVDPPRSKAKKPADQGSLF